MKLKFLAFLQYYLLPQSLLHKLQTAFIHYRRFLDGMQFICQTVILEDSIRSVLLALGISTKAARQTERV